MNYKTRALVVFAVFLALLVAAPLALVFSGWLQPGTDIWRHLVDTLLGELVSNTLVLLAGVSLMVAVLGIGFAWLTTMCNFPGRRFFDWALMMPLAVPAYVLAFVFIGVFDFSGPVQGVLFDLFGRDYWFPEVRSTGGVILVMSLAFYPYVYLLTRAAFLSQGSGCMEAARMLGRGPLGAFFGVALPMARPAIVAGVSLAMMETLADFGTVAVFNYDTFTTAIYKAWFGLFNLQAASQLASMLLVVVVLALTLEQGLRGRSRFHETGRNAAPHRIQLSGLKAWLATSGAAVVFMLGFLMPMVQLFIWSLEVIQHDLDSHYLSLLGHTLILAFAAAFIIIFAALLQALAKRFAAGHLVSTSARITSLGYALPGSVLAVGVMLALTGFDNLIHMTTRVMGFETQGQILTGTLVALLFAYLVRFLYVASGPIDAGLSRIKQSTLEAAQNLGVSGKGLMLRIYIPLLRPGLLTALLLVLVDVMKEMPATLLLRPFGWDTLAVRIYEMTSEGEWVRAALPAISLILVGLIPIYILAKQSRQKGY